MNISNFYNSILNVLRITGQTIKMPNPEVFISLFSILVSFMLPLVLFLIQKNEDSKEATAWMHLVARKLVKFKYIWFSILIFLGAEVILLRFGRNVYVSLITTVIILLCFCVLIIQLSLIIRWLVDEDAGIKETSYQNVVQKNLLTKYTKWDDFIKNWRIFYKYLSASNKNSVFNNTSLFYKLWRVAYSNIVECENDNEQFYFIQLLISSYDEIQLFPRKLDLEFLKFCLEEYSAQSRTNRIAWDDLVQRQINSVINNKDSLSQYEICNIINTLSEFMNNRYSGGKIENIASIFLKCLESLDDYVEIEENLPATFQVTINSLMDSKNSKSSTILMRTYFARYQQKKYKFKNDVIASKIFSKADIIFLGKIYFTLETINRVNLNSKSHISDVLFNSMKNMNGFGYSGPVETITSQGDDNEDRQLFIKREQERKQESIRIMAIYYLRYYGESKLFLDYLDTLIEILSSPSFIKRSKSENIDGERSNSYHLLIELRKSICQ
ncbi:hypothetical protein [Limosilactobacillus portuensis]|uniref:hypothetical protein n=1 Tax=Limosilactobacillus portuensis TaxID=2742601 RepID=UPI003D73AF82